MWNALGGVAVDWYEKQASPQARGVVNISIRDSVQLMRMTWEQAKMFRVSDTVMMTEKQIIWRLQGEGHLDRFKELPDLLPLVCA